MEKAKAGYPNSCEKSKIELVNFSYPALEISAFATLPLLVVKYNNLIFYIDFDIT